MTNTRIGQHLVDTWIEPFSILDLPNAEHEITLHGERRILPPKHKDRPIIVLTEIGRAILCAHIAGSLPQTSLSPDLIQALSTNSQVNPPTKLNSWGLHFLNVLWNMRGIALRRSDLNAIKSALAESFKNHPHPEWFPKRSEDDDIIQHVNKTGQWGLKHNAEFLRSPSGDSVNYYWISTPLEFTTPRELRKDGVPQNFTSPVPACDCLIELSEISEKNDRDLVLERFRVIQYLSDSFLHVPVSDWTLEGHKDAQNKERGTVAQPKRFNRSARDRWKFDDYGLTRCPSVGNLIDNLRDFYPSNEELTELLQALKKEIGTEPLTDSEDFS
jgi:hypothetical protein